MYSAHVHCTVQCTFTPTLRVSYSTFFLKNNLPIPMFLLFIAKYYYNIFVLFLQYHRRSNKNIKIALSDVFSIFWLTWAARDVSGYSVRFHRYFRTFPTFVAPKFSSCIVTISVVDPYTFLVDPDSELFFYRFFWGGQLGLYFSDYNT